MILELLNVWPKTRQAGRVVHGLLLISPGNKGSTHTSIYHMTQDILGNEPGVEDAPK